MQLLSSVGLITSQIGIIKLVKGRRQILGEGAAFWPWMWLSQPSETPFHFEEDTLASFRDMTVSARWLPLRSMSRDDKWIIIADDVGQQHLCGISVRGGLSS